MTINSSFATCPYSYPTPPKPGSSTFCPHRSMTRMTWLGSSEETSRAHTCALVTSGTSGVVDRSRMKPCMSTSRRFSKQRTELPNITDSNVIGAFLASTTCRDLVSKLGRKTPTKASELMDIATKFASGQEAIEAIFHKHKGKGKWKKDAPKASTQRNSKKNKKKKVPQKKHKVLKTDLVATTNHRSPRGPLGGPNVFDKLLKESCPITRAQSSTPSSIVTYFNAT
jgi:hypothetical protein